MWVVTPEGHTWLKEYGGIVHGLHSDIVRIGINAALGKAIIEGQLDVIDTTMENVDGMIIVQWEE